MVKKFIILFILSFFINSCQNSEEKPNTVNTTKQQNVQPKENEKQENIQLILEEKINLDTLRKLVYKDLKDFKTIKVYMQTSKFKIWIDQMEDGSYRYASWPKSKTIDSSPCPLFTKYFFKF